MAYSDIPSGEAARRGAVTSDLLDCLRERIFSGYYPEGSWLPAERDLAAELGVARRSVRVAIVRLSEEGLVQCRSRFRPVVQPLPLSPPVGRSRATTAVSGTSAPPRASTMRGEAGDRLVALVMWHGPPEEQGATAQQRIFWGMNQRLAQSGFHGIFLDMGDTVRSEEENAEREAARLRYACEQSFAGIIFYPYAYRSNRELIQQTARCLPLILIDRMIPGIQADYVGVDNYGAMREATCHLRDQGHRRIVYVTKPEPINTVQDRLAGYQQAMREAQGSGEAPLPENVLIAPDKQHTVEWTAFDSLFTLPSDRRPTAVLCVNDDTALLVHQRLRGLGLTVPRDVALAGFDNIMPLLPDGISLTTVAQPFEQIGRTAAEAFLARRSAPQQTVSGTAELWHRELTAHLIERGSTLPVAPPSLPISKEFSLVP